MFAGKTSKLLEIFEETPGEKIIFGPVIDTRGDFTHDGKAFKIKRIFDPIEILKTRPAEAQTVFIDEVQFFPASILTVIESLRLIGINVVAAGLRTTSEGAPFGPILSLLLAADEVLVLKALCSECGKPADFSEKIGRPGINGIGGAESYAPRCRRHFRGGAF